MAFRRQWDVDPPRGLSDHPLCVHFASLLRKDFSDAKCSLGLLFRRRPSHRDEFERACDRWRRERKLLCGIGRDFVFTVDEGRAFDAWRHERIHVMIFRSRRELRRAVDELKVREVMDS